MMSYKADHSVKWRFSILGVLAGLALLAMTPAKAEYADVIINNYADAAGMRPVVFPHWFHRIRFRCKVCFVVLGFFFLVGGFLFFLVFFFVGKFCGDCHNGV